MTLTAERVREVLDYDHRTGVFMWRVGQRKGRRAGNISPRGYRRIMVDRCMHLEHVLAWLYVYGEWPSQQIDHKDNDKANNRLSNLRLATNSQNHINKGLQRNNTSGFKGVSWDTQIQKWRARIKVNGVNKYVGVFDDVAAAGAARAEAERKFFGEFAYGGE